MLIVKLPKKNYKNYFFELFLHTKLPPIEIIEAFSFQSWEKSVLFKFTYNTSFSSKLGKMKAKKDFHLFVEFYASLGT